MPTPEEVAREKIDEFLLTTDQIPTTNLWSAPSATSSAPSPPTIAAPVVFHLTRYDSEVFPQSRRVFRAQSDREPSFPHLRKTFPHMRP